MAISLPSSPTVGQTYTLGGKIWTWNGTAWKLPSTTSTLPVLYGGTGVTTSTGTGSTVLSVSPTFTGSVGIGTTPVVSTTSPLQIAGDLAFIGSNRSILGNLYYSSGWKYAANGYGWGFREDGAGKLQIASAPNNTSGAAAAATVTLGLCSFDLTTRAVNIPGDTTLAAYTETIVTLGTVAAAATLAITTGTFITATLTTATACTFTMPTVAAGKSFILYLRQPAAGTPTTATFTNVKWGSAGAPTITATVGKMDILSFSSDGTAWYGAAAQGYTY